MEICLSKKDISSDTNRVHGTSEYEEPRGDVERAFAQLWKELFHADKIGRNDNFFELGGNSLLGMDLSEMFATRLEIDVSALTIFQYPTVAALAQLMEADPQEP